MTAYKKIVTFFESIQHKEDFAAHHKEFDSILDELILTLTILDEELKKNLQDPMSRFKESEQCFEIISTYASGKVDVLLEREKVGNNHVLLKNNIKYFFFYFRFYPQRTIHPLPMYSMMMR